MPHAWNSWRREHQLTMMSRTFPPLPPGSVVTIITLRLELPFPVDNDVSIDLTCGSKNGPGTARTIFLPNTILTPAVKHYTFQYDSLSQRQAADKVYEPAIKECLK
jgi:hypothetical protein